VFKSKPIKRRVKSHFNSSKHHLNFKKQISFQITNNNYMTAPTFPNPYIIRKLNNMDKAQVLKKEQDDWTRMYYKMLKGLETMINVQRQV